jgi:hypothetical protein
MSVRIELALQSNFIGVRYIGPLLFYSFYSLIYVDLDQASV